MMCNQYSIIITKLFLNWIFSFEKLKINSSCRNSLQKNDLLIKKLFNDQMF